MFGVRCKRTGRLLAWDCTRAEADAIVKVVSGFGVCCSGQHVAVVRQEAVGKVAAIRRRHLTAVAS